MVICQTRAKFTQKQAPACDLPRCQFGLIVIHNTNALYAAMSTVQRAVTRDHFVKNINSTACVVVVGYDFWLVLIISHDRVVSVLGRHQHNSFFSYTSKTASDVTEAMRLEQEAVLLYLSVTACDHCFRISHRRSQMTGRDFSHVGEVTTRLSVYHGTHVISCRYGRCYLPRQSVSVSLHPTALTTPV